MPGRWWDHIYLPGAKRKIGMLPVFRYAQHKNSMNSPFPDPRSRASTFFRLFEALLVFLACLAVFAVFNRELLFEHGLIPTYDFSANDLLIQDAKHFALLHGNYSKIGFFHPGPFFLQLMAAVEWLGVDVTGVIASPIGAHAFSAALLHAASVSTLYLALRELFESRLFGVVGAIATLAICRAMIDAEPAFFTALWMPYLYMAASVFVLAACIGMTTSGWRWLPVAILGLCMLGHGHASFVGLAPIMAVTGAAALWALHRWGPASLSLKALPGTVVAASAVIVVLFALPIVANTILHFPGEIPKYFRFAGQNKTDSTMASLAYIGRFFQFSLLAIPAFLLLPSRLGNPRTKAAIAIALATGLPAAIFYVLRGLDSLEYLYPLYWATIFVGGSAAVAVLGLIKSYGARPAQSVVAAIVGFVAVMSVPASSLTPPLGQPQGEFPAALAGVQASAPPGTYAWVDVEMVNFQVIFDMATLASLDKRQARRSFCIVGETWHSMYPPYLRCDAQRNPMSVRLHARDREKFPSAHICFGHTALSTDAPADAEAAAQCSLVKSEVIYASGWAATGNTEGRWTVGKEAVLMIPSADLPKRFSVRLKLRGLTAPSLPTQNITFLNAKGETVGRAKTSQAEPTDNLRVDLERSESPDGLTALRIQVDSPRVPAQLGLGADTRELGVYLTQISIVR